MLHGIGENGRTKLRGKFKGVRGRRVRFYFLFFFLPPPPPLDDVLDDTEAGDEESEVVVGLWISRRGLIGRGEGEDSGVSSLIGAATLTGGARDAVQGIEVTSSGSSEGREKGLIAGGGGAESSSSKLSKSSSSKGGWLRLSSVRRGDDLRA